MPATPVISIDPSPTTTPSMALATMSSVTRGARRESVAPLKRARESDSRGRSTASGLFTAAPGSRLIFRPELAQHAVGQVERLVSVNDVSVGRVEDEGEPLFRSDGRHDGVHAIDDRFQVLFVQPADPPAGSPLFLNEFLVLPYLLTQDSILFVALRLAQHRTLLVEFALHLVDLVLLLSSGLGEVRHFPLERDLRFLGFLIIGKDLI